ncbi:MAG: hypothetical protein MMC23_005291 [Stictis urceolatum]|nr:hypothetical protein [Stictis urceolata]
MSVGRLHQIGKEYREAGRETAKTIRKEVGYKARLNVRRVRKESRRAQAVRKAENDLDELYAPQVNELTHRLNALSTPVVPTDHEHLPTIGEQSTIERGRSRSLDEDIEMGDVDRIHGGRHIYAHPGPMLEEQENLSLGNHDGDGMRDERTAERVESDRGDKMEAD